MPEPHPGQGAHPQPGQKNRTHADWSAARTILGDADDNSIWDSVIVVQQDLGRCQDRKQHVAIEEVDRGVPLVPLLFIP